MMDDKVRCTGQLGTRSEDTREKVGWASLGTGLPSVAIGRGTSETREDIARDNPSCIVLSYPVIVGN